MSVVVARDQSNAGHIIFPWPNPLPWGAQVVCTENEIAIICPNWEVGEKLGPGRHTISPPNPQSHVLAYFVTTTPQSIMFERLIAVIDGSTGKPVLVRFFGSAQIKIGDPMLMCHQLVGLPYHDLATGILRSARLSLCRCFQNIIARICMAHASVAAIANPDAVAQIVNMAANSQPMAVAVVGLEMIRFEQFGVSINNGEPIVWKAGPAAGDGGRASSAPLRRVEESSVDEDLDARTDLDHPPSTQSGQHPPVPAMTGRPSQPNIYAQRQSNPQIPAAAPPRRKTPPLGSPMQSSETPLPAGCKVLVYWNDGLWRAATVRHYEAGRYQVALTDSDAFAWVQANQVRPA